MSAAALYLFVEGKVLNMLTKRSVASVVVFSILTFGIYMVWWTHVTCTALQREGRVTSIPTVLTVLMMLFHSSVGGVLLAIDADDNLNAIKRMRALPVADNKVLWLAVGIFVPIVTVALVQNEINTLLDAPASGAYRVNDYGNW